MNLGYYKTFAHQKKPPNSVKRQLTKRENILGKYPSDKGLLSRGYKQLKKIIHPKFKDATEMTIHFSDEEIQLASKYMKKNFSITGHYRNEN